MARPCSPRTFQKLLPKITSQSKTLTRDRPAVEATDLLMFVSIADLTGKIIYVVAVVPLV